MRTYAAVIDTDVIVLKKTVGVGSQIKMNTHLIKQDSPDGLENIYVLTALRQEVRGNSETR